jgi:hypothetical protein
MVKSAKKDVCPRRGFGRRSSVWAAPIQWISRTISEASSSIERGFAHADLSAHFLRQRARVCLVQRKGNLPFRELRSSATALLKGLS